jgi:hypothetical protein
MKDNPSHFQSRLSYVASSDCPCPLISHPSSQDIYASADFWSIYFHHSRFLALPFCSVLFKDFNAFPVAFAELYRHTFGKISSGSLLKTPHEALTAWYDYPECVHKNEIEPVIIWLRSIKSLSRVGFVKDVGHKVHYKIISLHCLCSMLSKFPT